MVLTMLKWLLLRGYFDLRLDFVVVDLWVVVVVEVVVLDVLEAVVVVTIVDVVVVITRDVVGKHTETKFRREKKKKVGDTDNFIGVMLF